MEKLAGDLFLGSKLVRLSILPTQETYFLCVVLGELKCRSLGIKGVN